MASEQYSVSVIDSITVDPDELTKALALLFNYSTCLAGPMSIKCAIDLGIPDAVACLSANSSGSGVTLPDLLASLPLVHPSKRQHIPRILALLVHLGVFTTAPRRRPENSSTTASGGDPEELAYLPTALSSLLASRETSRWSMTDFVDFSLHPAFQAPWYHLGDWFRMGPDEGAATAFELAHGEPMWELLGKKPALSSLFNDSMAGVSRLSVDLLIRQCGEDVFGGLRSLVDVGGGTGATAKAIKRAFPEIQCTVLDLPSSISMAVLHDQSEDIRFVAGDMFQDIPNADAILLKGVLHNWNDDDCIKVLMKCKDVVPTENGRVIVHDTIIDSNDFIDQKVKEAQLFFDLTMMLAYNGKERNRLQWENIFTRAGFKKFEVKKELGTTSLMIAYP